jgi:hypothetical protein
MEIEGVLFSVELVSAMRQPEGVSDKTATPAAFVPQPELVKESQRWSQRINLDVTKGTSL